MRAFKSDVEYIRLAATAGSHVNECLAEAIEICAREHNDVHLVHNDKLYRVKFKKLMEAVVSEPRDLREVAYREPRGNT